MSEMSFTLPVPPTLNHMYANVPGRGRVKSRRYTAWRSLAVGLILVQAKGGVRMGGKIAVTINLPSKILGDIDNRVKPILDALVTSGRIDDDRHVQRITVEKTRTEADVLVSIEEAA
mgnify:CR=1 FL=1